MGILHKKHLDGQKKKKTDENVRVKWRIGTVARRASNELGFSLLQDRRKVLYLLHLYFKTAMITNSSCMYYHWLLSDHA